MQSIPLVPFHYALRQAINTFSEQQVMEQHIDLEINGEIGNSIAIANSLLQYANTWQLVFDDVSLFHRDIRHAFNQRLDGKFVVNPAQGVLGITSLDAWLITRQAIMLVPEGEDIETNLGNRSIIHIYRVEVDNQN